MNKYREHPFTSAGINHSMSDVPTSFQEIEVIAANEIREKIRSWLEDNQEGAPQATTRCRECGEVAVYHSQRVGHARTKFGIVRYKRACYVCPHCRHSTFPLDERLSPYESLARLRAKLEGGKSLPVAELAKAWGLGSLNPYPIHESPPTKEPAGINPGDSQTCYPAYFIPVF